MAHPTNFSVEDNEKCSTREHLPICDQYLVTLTNVGGGEAGDPITIADSLPIGLKVVYAHGENLKTEAQFGCSTAVVITCTYKGSVEPDVSLAVFVEVEVEPGTPPGAITNIVTVTSPGALRASTSEPLTLPNTINELPGAFGISAFGFGTQNVSGQSDVQAGDHPYGVTSTVNLNTILEPRPGSSIPFKFGSFGRPRDIAVYLPLGFFGNPTAAPQCTELQLVAQGRPGETECPPASRVGNLTVFVGEFVYSSTNPEASFDASPVYNMRPEAGYPAQFGFKAFNKQIPLYASLVHTSGGYEVRIATPGIPDTVNVQGVALTLFGEPNLSQAFFTNPADCSAGPLKAQVDVDSWVHPHQWVSDETVSYPQIIGCDLLQFEPRVEMQPEVTQAEEPSGYEIKIRIPQNPERFPALATPQLKNVAINLPEGMMISPGGGGGLEGCEATGPNGIDLPTGGGTPTEVGEGEALGPDDMTRLVPGHCPHQSQIGTVEIVSPLLSSPLEGRVYIAQPKCGGPGQPVCTAADATNGNLFGIYLEAEGSGTVVKLAGSVSVNPTTGQITTKFLENPQLPVSEVIVQLKGGARAPLANPRQCGEALTNADLTPWSSPMTPDAITTSEFPIDWNGNGGPCPATLPFAPTLEAGSTSPLAGHFGSFTLTVGRGDRQQDLSRLQVKMPPGLLGVLAKVPLCEEPQASSGMCSETSKVGTTWVAAGSGPQPLWVQGQVYLTGPYAGAPFGLSIVVPAIAGPFNLGDVVVRSRIDIDPSTAQVTVTSDPLPQFKDGVPLRIQKLNVTINREGFIFNPTNCTAKQVEATFESAQGAMEAASSPFAVEACKGLPFKPTFVVSTQAKTSKLKGASLVVKVGSSVGQANIARAVASLPKQLPARLTTLQKACPEATFNQNPAQCPASSEVGIGRAVTPLLNTPLVGPVYLESHGGAAFPDLVVILQGQGVRLDLRGNTSIAKGVTTSTFATVPDAPVTSFELKLPEGPHSALGADLPAKAKGDLCGIALTMPTTLTGQNGAAVKQSTKIAVTGCPKPKKAAKKAKKARR